jgi:hypothetical protein
MSKARRRVVISCASGRTVTAPMDFLRQPGSENNIKSLIINFDCLKELSFRA